VRGAGRRRWEQVALERADDLRGALAASVAARAIAAGTAARLLHDEPGRGGDPSAVAGIVTHRAAIQVAHAS
jgi:hypothetical protein